MPLRSPHTERRRGRNTKSNNLLSTLIIDAHLEPLVKNGVIKEIGIDVSISVPFDIPQSDRKGYLMQGLLAIQVVPLLLKKKHVRFVNTSPPQAVKYSHNILFKAVVLISNTRTIFGLNPVLVAVVLISTVTCTALHDVCNGLQHINI